MGTPLVGVEVGSAAIRAVLMDAQARSVTAVATRAVEPASDPVEMVSAIWSALGLEPGTPARIAATAGIRYSGVGSGPEIFDWVEALGSQIGEPVVAVGDSTHGVSYAPERLREVASAVATASGVGVERLELPPVALVRVLPPGTTCSVAFDSGVGWRARMHSGRLLEASVYPDGSVPAGITISAPGHGSRPLEALHRVEVADGVVPSPADLAIAVGAARGLVEPGTGANLASPDTPPVPADPRPPSLAATSSDRLEAVGAGGMASAVSTGRPPMPPAVDPQPAPAADSSEVGTSEVGTSEVGTSEVGTSEVGTSEVGTPEVGTSEAVRTGPPLPGPVTIAGESAPTAAAEPVGNGPAQQNGSQPIDDAAPDVGPPAAVASPKPPSAPASETVLERASAEGSTAAADTAIMPGDPSAEARAVSSPAAGPGQGPDPESSGEPGSGSAPVDDALQTGWALPSPVEVEMWPSDAPAPSDASVPAGMRTAEPPKPPAPPTPSVVDGNGTSPLIVDGEPVPVETVPFETVAAGRSRRGEPAPAGDAAPTDAPGEAAAPDRDATVGDPHQWPSPRPAEKPDETATVPPAPPGEPSGAVTPPPSIDQTPTVPPAPPAESQPLSGNESSQPVAPVAGAPGLAPRRLTPPDPPGWSAPGEAEAAEPIEQDTILPGRATSGPVPDHRRRGRPGPEADRLGGSVGRTKPPLRERPGGPGSGISEGSVLAERRPVPSTGRSTVGWLKLVVLALLVLAVALTALLFVW